MATFTGGDTVRGGYYVNTRGWNIEAIDGASGALPGDAHTTYRKVPILALVALAPLMGLGLVLVVPFLGVAVLAEQMWKTLVGVLTRTRTRAQRAEATIARRR